MTKTPPLLSLSLPIPIPIPIPIASASSNPCHSPSHTTHQIQMEPHRGSASEPENPIAACAAMLSLRLFSACRDLARRLPRSDPIVSASRDRILAIADVLSAADLYSVLQLRRADAGDRDLALRQFKRLALLLDPTEPHKFPLSDEALARAREAWHVLSDPERRALYDRTTTFWTACPYCWNLYEYQKRYEDCALRCEGCRRAFHGVAVEPPVKAEEETVVEQRQRRLRRRHYYWCQASVPLRYCEKEDENVVMGDQEQTRFVYVSDDDDGDGVGREGLVKKVVKGDVGNEGRERVVQGNGTVELQGNGKRRMRVKTVAKKVVGNRMRSRQGCLDVDSDLDLDLDGEDGELEFTAGDRDVFVGVRFNK